MDLEDVKALIRSLLISSTQKSYSLQQLLQDFHDETGSNMPIFHYPDEKSFLMSLTDTVKVTGQLNKENVTSVKSKKSSHIESLICRQIKMSQNHTKSHFKNSNFFPDFHSDNGPSGKTIKSNDKSDISETKYEISKPKSFGKHNQSHLKYDEGMIHEKETPNLAEYERDKSSEESDFIFKEDEIPSLCPEMFQSNSIYHSFPAPSSSDNLSETDSVTTSSNSPNEEVWIPDGVKMKLKELIGFQTHGIWCRELPDLYNQLYSSPLDYKEYGFRSLIEMIMSLNEIFRNVRPYDEDWLLFDASKAPTEEEKEFSSRSKYQQPNGIDKNAISLLQSHFETSGKSSIEIGDFLLLYFIKYGVKLEYREYGFRNVKDFIKKLLRGRNFTIAQEQNKLVINPISCTEYFSDRVHSLMKPVNGIDDELFPELFPDDVCSDEKFTYLDMEKYFMIGKMIQVVVTDVWSPTHFYVQLEKYKKDFKSLMNNLEKFYNENKVKYRMPKVMLQPGRVCVAWTKSSTGVEEWYRSEITGVNKTTVKVHFVDYGMNCKVKFEDVRFMHRSFLDLPAQGFAAKLSNIRPASTKKWPLDASERFLKLVSTPRASLSVKSLDLRNKRVCGTLFIHPNNLKESVNDILIKEGKALFTENEPGESFSFTEEEDDAEENPTETEEGKSSDVSTAAFDCCDSKARTGTDDKFSDCERECVDPESTETVNDGNIVTAKVPPPPLIADIQKNKLYFDSEKRLRLSWTVEKEIEALAYKVLSENQFIKGIARNNFDFGLQCAKTLAEKIVFSPEVSLP